MSNITKLGIDRCENYIFDNVYRAVHEVAEKTDFPNVSGKTVLLKPNILTDVSESACITTHSEVVRAVIRLVKEKGASKILVGDSPGLHTDNFNAKKSGIYDVCTEEGAVWCNFTDNPRTIMIPEVNHKLPVSRFVLDSDVVIGISKMKTHQLMYLTGCVKNFFGTVTGLNKSACHMAFPNRDSFASLIVNLHEYIKPSYSFMDGVIAMEGPGPANGSPRPVGLILGSDNDYAVDIAQAVISGYEVNQIPILSYAKKNGLLPDNINCTILNYKDLVVKDYKIVPIRKKTKLFSSLVLPFLSRKRDLKKDKKQPVPTFNTEKCKLCQRCVNICPAKALKFEDKQIILDKDKCIRCYCCHEMCLHDAISVTNTIR